MKINILIVEDEKIINDYICAILQNDKFNLISCFNGQEAQKILAEKTINLIITDLLMENGDGFSLLEYVKDKNLNIPVVVISALSDEDNLYKAYELGAIDYLTKPINKNILKLKVNNINKYFIDEEREEINFIEDQKTIKLDGEIIDFTKTEYDIMKLLYDKRPRIYTKDNLIDIIWNSNYGMSDKVVEVNIFNIRKKLGHYSRHLKTKRGIGYYFEDTI